jgi:type I restriction enzyme S subunit
MKSYEAYKYSGIEWIGDIPEGWEVVRFKRLFREKKKVTNASLNSGSISFGEVVYKDDEKITEATKQSYQVLSEGEFLLNPLNMNYDLKSLRIGLSAINVVVSSGYIILQSKNDLDKSYYRWLLRIYDIVFMKTLGAGVRQTINFNDLADTHLVLPPLSEQTAIAEFLDDKTAKIDQTIAIKQKEIELLKERRQILIQQAVTGKWSMVNGQWLKTQTEKLKPSGVDWIGEIPEHWEVRKLKYVANVVLGKMICNEDKGNYQLKPYLKSKNIQWLELNLDSVDEMWFSEKELSQYKLNKGDIVVSEGGEVGKATLWNDELPECYIQNSAHKVTLHSTNNNIYHLFCFFVLGKLGVFESVVNKVSIGHLTREKLTNINFPHPSSDEQTQIVSYLEDIEAKIAKAITLKEQEIEKLKEYKTVLIDQVVTGKVRVNKIN